MSTSIVSRFRPSSAWPSLHPRTALPFPPMQVRRSMVLPLTIAGALAMGAPAALAGGAQTSGTDRTYPSVKPRVGHRHSGFELTFTLAQAAGRTGLVSTYYREVVSPPAHASQSCSPAPPAPVFSGRQGATMRIPLHPPAHGWCRGRYDVTVFLERTPVCGPPIEPAGFIPCPLSAGGVPTFHSVAINTGDTHFTVH